MGSQVKTLSTVLNIPDQLSYFIPAFYHLWFLWFVPMLCVAFLAFFFLAFPSFVHMSSVHSDLCSICVNVCVCRQQMRLTETVDSFVEGTMQPQRRWYSLDGSCRRSTNSCAASTARTPRTRRCYRYTHITAHAHMPKLHKQLCYSRLQREADLGWRDFSCWQQFKVLMVLICTTAGNGPISDFRCAVINHI